MSCSVLSVNLRTMGSSPQPQAQPLAGLRLCTAVPWMRPSVQLFFWSPNPPPTPPTAPWLDCSAALRVSGQGAARRQMR